jgi:hypothetical protein
MVLLFCKSGCIEQYYYCYGFTTGNIPRSNTHIYYDQNSGVLTVTSDLTQVADLPIYKDENTSTQESITVMLSDHLIHTLPYLNIPSTPIRSMTGNSLTTSWTLNNNTILPDTLTVHISLDGWNHLAAPFVETVAINIVNEPEDQNTNAEAEDVAVHVQENNEEEDEE